VRKPRPLPGDGPWEHHKRSLGRELGGSGGGDGKSRCIVMLIKQDDLKRVAEGYWFRKSEQLDCLSPTRVRCPREFRTSR